MNICMVGYGGIAECHMAAFSEIPSVHPYVLVGRRAEPSAAFAKQWGFAHHSLDLDASLADPQVDAVVITSPNALHVTQAEKSLVAGKHVLLEIPIAMSFADAQRVTELSRRVDRRLMICHTMRYMPALREVRRRVAQGKLRIHQIACIFGIMRRTNANFLGKPRSWTDNILWHHGAHLVDLALWITGCGEPSDIHCRFGPLHPTQAVMDMSLLMVLPDGVLVTITQSYNLSRFRWRVVFIGEEETLEFSEGALHDAAGNVIVPQHSITDLHDQDQEFVNSVGQGRDPAITGEQVLPAMHVLEQAQASADAAAMQ